jgi:shikimate 5-dehydrogenase
MNINKDTLLFGSFSQKAGNVGCVFFNHWFHHYKIDAIYKSFTIHHLEDAILSAKTLGFSGFAVSMPYKTKIILYLDEIDDIVKKTNSCNTVLLKDGKLWGYNTDYYSIFEYLRDIENNKIFILGNGAYSKNVQICCLDLGKSFEIITRELWHTIELIENSVIFNCTPVENIEFNHSNIFIDCINTTPTGKILANKQASLQFALYTGILL